MVGHLIWFNQMIDTIEEMSLGNAVRHLSGKMSKSRQH